MDADRELPAAPNAVQPNEQATDYLVNLAPDQEGCASIPPAPGDHSGHSAPSGTRALVDGVGVYTASPGSPFLTAPVVATSDSTAELVPGTQLAATADLEISAASARQRGRSLRTGRCRAQRNRTAPPPRFRSGPPLARSCTNGRCAIRVIDTDNGRRRTSLLPPGRTARRRDRP
jgi:hypothetical protein